MFKYIAVAVVVLTITLGCAGRSPVAPEIDQAAQIGVRSQRADQIGPHRLWQEGILYFSEDHNRVDVVPRRHGRFHLNALKFLEETCTDCLEITRIQNNGDGTINLTVKITHPFPGHPQYTGFDVKGIIMFNGSLELEWGSSAIFPYSDPVVVSWRERGDPEVLNPDGYSPRWSPWWDSGSSMPIFNYWPGKYSNGLATANVNAFLNFYTDEERHMFRVDRDVDRTYHISLPPGPVVAGYAIEACWEPPTVTTVTDPISDFPFSANQREPYHFRYVINNNEPITEAPCCGNFDYDCTDVWVETLHWYGEKPNKLVARYYDWEAMLRSTLFYDCPPQSPPPKEHRQAVDPRWVTEFFGDGSYRGAAVVYYYGPPDWANGTDRTRAYHIFDFVIDID